MLVCPLCRIALSDPETTCSRDGHEGIRIEAPSPPEALQERFEVVEVFGQGPTSDLFLADDRETGRRGLLKVLRHDDVAPGERTRRSRELLKQLLSVS
jgi:serine/threonine protein kinase